MNKIEWSKKALKQARNIPSLERQNIVSKIGGLKNFPNCQNIKRLTNHEFDYRLRVGRYRVMFDYDGTLKIISIEEVKKRDESTY